MVLRASAISAVALLALLSTSVDAHGELVLPKPTYHQWGGNVCSTIATNKLTVSGTAYGAEYPKAWDTAITAAGMSLKDFILKNQDMSGASVAGSTAECGYSDPAGEAQPLPEKINFNSGFIHQGPCEGYCDDVLVTTHTADCRATYPGGLVPYDKAKCAGAKRFTFYWLGMDSGNGAAWQVYTNCVPLSGSGSASAGNSSSSSGSTTTKPAATPVPSTAAPSADADDEYDNDTPAATTTAPSAGSDDEYDDNDTPAATTTAPAATTKTPAATTTAPSPAATPKTNCKRRARRD